ncbi:hypothetical protein JB92DRAFT_2827808 [Gautieria morchelliformis]|nr:hypothetical protein JB92DRAFT_2827808 [Gautieria morchelliformis]
MPSQSSKSSQSTRRSSRTSSAGEVNAMMVDVMPTPHQPYHLQTLSARDRTIPLLRNLEVLEYDRLTPTPQQSNDLQDAVQLAARVVLDAIKSPAPGLRGDRTWGGGGVGQAAVDGLYDGDGERGEIGVLWLERAV